MDVKDNSAEFLEKMSGRSKEESAPVYPLSAKRRLISSGLGQRRKFAGVVYGQDIRSPVSSDDFSGAIDLGPELPSPSELASHEEGIERRKKFSKDKKIPVPIPLPKKRDGRFKL